MPSAVTTGMCVPRGKNGDRENFKNSLAKTSLDDVKLYKNENLFLSFFLALACKLCNVVLFYMTLKKIKHLNDSTMHRKSIIHVTNECSAYVL